MTIDMAHAMELAKAAAASLAGRRESRWLCDGKDTGTHEVKILFADEKSAEAFLAAIGAVVADVQTNWEAGKGSGLPRGRHPGRVDRRARPRQLRQREAGQMSDHRTWTDAEARRQAEELIGCPVCLRCRSHEFDAMFVRKGRTLKVLFHCHGCETPCPLVAYFDEEEAPVAAPIGRGPADHIDSLKPAPSLTIQAGPSPLSQQIAKDLQAELAVLTGANAKIEGA